MPIVLNTNVLLRPVFSGGEFSATKWDSVDQKADFANKLCKFICADFKESLFTKVFYGRLNMTFGHIAHYNREGFFSQFFGSLSGKIEFLEQTLQWPCFGDAEYTYSDVERAVQLRLRKSGLLEGYRALRAAEIEQAERETLKRLSQKYEGAQAEASPTILKTPPARSTRQISPDDQQSLF